LNLWLNLLIYPAPDLPGQWVAHCLETDLVSQGNDPAHALEMIAEAIELVARQNIEKGRPPLVYRNAPVEVYRMFESAKDIATKILKISSNYVQNEITLSPHVARAC
jgi:predicted RNase H-like HicB family nuclease